MKSPFPGMDPYLELHWLDVHTRLVAYVADALNERLPTGLVATTEERVAIESEELPPHSYRMPDVSVYGPASSSESSAAGDVAVAAYRLVLDSDPITEKFIRILETNGDRLITVLELVSPTNKVGEGLKEYRRKRTELVAAGVHVVEFDLVRQGNWRELLRPYLCPRKLVTMYRAIVHFGGPKRVADLYPIGLRRPLPEILVPLRPDDRPVRLEMQPLLEQVYVRGRYSQRLNYAEACEPPLEGEDAVWADELLKKAGKR